MPLIVAKVTTQEDVLRELKEQEKHLQGQLSDVQLAIRELERDPSILKVVDEASK